MKTASVSILLAALAFAPVGSLTSVQAAPSAKDETPLPPPMSVRTIAPVYPLDMLLAGRSGWAEVVFTVEYSGHVILPNAIGSSDPEFGKALLAEIEGTEFMPPRRNGIPVLSSTQERFSFSGETSLDPAARQILTELRKAKPAILTADQLDNKLTPIRQDPPSFPYAQKSDGLSGKAEIEVIIDKDGRPLFPRIISSTYDDFGWAAATAIKRWKYPSPMKNGQKVEARITVPFTFDYAKVAQSW